jgi:hypothetical protein
VARIAHRSHLHDNHLQPADARRVTSLIGVGAVLLPSLWLGQSLTEDLGRYEKVALEQALTARGLSIDPQPEGKRVGVIHVVNLPVFTREQDGFLTLGNALHVTTKEFIIRREVLLQPGMLWNEAKVFETKRNLRDPLFTTLVVAVPVRNPDPTRVDLLVITRDVWSLRLSTTLEFQEDTVTSLIISIAENNLFGRRKRVAAIFDMGLGSFSIGPEYIDRNILGSWLQLSHNSALIFARETGELEGSRSFTSFGLPLFALDRRWGFDLDVLHSVRVARSFTGTEIRTYDNPDTPEVEELPRIFRDRDVDFEGSVVRSFPGPFTHRIRWGGRVAWDSADPILPPDTPPEDVAAFERDVLSRSETRVGPFVSYAFFERKFRIYRNIDSFDFPEDVQMGPRGEARTSFNPRLLGSTVDSVNFSTTAGWTVGLGADSYLSISGGVSTRLEDEDLVDTLFEADLFYASPAALGFARLVVNADLDWLENETRNRFLSLGGDFGLRGFPIGAFTGDRRVVINTELRTLSVRLLFIRLGGALFYDTGHAWDVNLGITSDAVRERSPRFRHDFGAGIRFVIPQTGVGAWRVDWAFANEGTAASFPGRISGGFLQYF